jgi:hypothetical protein
VDEHLLLLLLPLLLLLLLLFLYLPGMCLKGGLQVPKCDWCHA